eukprot:gene2028-2350_t
MGPHTAPLGMRFYRHNPNNPQSFPASYNNSIFIVQRGSWNRRRKIGYRVMLLQLGRSSQGAALRPRFYKQFARGWLQNENKTNDSWWGRPVDVEQLPDGSMLVSDDHNGYLYRITYSGGQAAITTDVSESAAAGN